MRLSLKCRDMLFFLKMLNNLLKLLNSETAPSQLAAGLGFGMIAGLTPAMSLHNLVLFFIVALFRVNFSMFFLSFGFFSVIAFFLDPLFDRLGYWALVDWTALRPLWVAVTTGAIWPFFRFNNTIVAGSLVLSLVLFVPVVVLAIVAIRRYRAQWREKIQKSRFIKALKATPLYGVYEKYQNFRARLSVLS